MQYIPTIITFSHLRWDFVYQRPQHLLSRLASRHRVIFIEEPVPDKCDVLHWEFHSPEANILVCRPHTPSDAPGYSDEQIPYMRKLVRELIENETPREYVLWFYTPMAFSLAADLEPQAIVYDCMDELSHFKNAPPQLIPRE